MDAQEWNNTICALPNSHILQTWDWGEFKSHYGWKMLPQIWRDAKGCVDAAAMVLHRPMPIRGLAAQTSILYVPRGPLLDWNNSSTTHKVIQGLQELARKKRAIFIKIDPDLQTSFADQELNPQAPAANGCQVITQLTSSGWQYSRDQIQFRNTFHIDLTLPDETLLAGFSQKTRYNIRLAQRKGVNIRRGTKEDFPFIYQMYAETSVRDSFLIRPQTYYQKLWLDFMDRNLATILIAEVEGLPVAGLILFHFAGKAWYFYGMSRSQHREKMPNHLLQWSAIQEAKARGCSIYDLWGAPDQIKEDDPMWGVYRFKTGFGARFVQTIGAWDYPVNQWLYNLYTLILPKILAILRNKRKSETRQEVT